MYTEGIPCALHYVTPKHKIKEHSCSDNIKLHSSQIPLSFKELQNLNPFISPIDEQLSLPALMGIISHFPLQLKFGKSERVS